MNFLFILTLTALSALPLLYIPSFEDVFCLPKVSVLRGYTVFALLCLVFYFKEKIRPKLRSQIPLAPFAFLFCALVSTVFSIQPALSFWGLYQFYFWGFLALLGYAVLFFSSSLMLDDTKVFNIFKSSMWIGAIVALLGFIQYFTKYQFGGSYSGRIFATLGNPDYFAQYMMILIFISLMFINFKFGDNHSISNSPFEKGGKRGILEKQSNPPAPFSKGGFWYGTYFSSWIGFIFPLVFFCALALSGARSSFVGLICGLFFFFIAGKLWEKIKAAHCIVAAVILSVIFFSGLANNLTGRLALAFSGRDPNITSRLEGYKIILKLAIKHPVLGNGPDTLSVLFRQGVTKKYEDYSGKTTQQGYSHCEPLEVFFSMGALGLCAYLFMYFYFIQAAYRKYKATGKSEYLSIASLIIAFFVSNLFSFPSLTTNSIVFFAAGYIFYSPLTQPLPGGERRRYNGLRILSIFAVGIVGTYYFSIKPILAEIHYIKSAQAYNDGDGEKAVLEMTEALRYNGRESIYYFGFAKIYSTLAAETPDYLQKEEYYTKAVNIFRQDLAHNPYYALAYSSIGSMYYNMAHYALENKRTNEFVRYTNEAVKNLLEALKYDQYLPNAYQTLGRCYALLGAKDTSEMYFQKFKEISGSK